eukprot:1159443-Pelagomonas_calceolata.AAC.3
MHIHTHTYTHFDERVQGHQVAVGTPCARIYGTCINPTSTPTGLWWQQGRYDWGRLNVLCDEGNCGVRVIQVPGTCQGGESSIQWRNDDEEWLVHMVLGHQKVMHTMTFKAIAASPENGFGCVDGLLTFDHNWHVRGSTSNGSGGIMTASFEHTRHRERSKRTPSERSIPQVWKQAIHCCKLQVASVWGTPFANSNG